MPIFLQLKVWLTSACVCVSWLFNSNHRNENNRIQYTYLAAAGLGWLLSSYVSEVVKKAIYLIAVISKLPNQVSTVNLLLLSKSDKSGLKKEP